MKTVNYLLPWPQSNVFVFPNFSLHSDTFSKIFNYYIIKNNVNHSYIFLNDRLLVSVFIKLY